MKKEMKIFLQDWGTYDYKTLFIICNDFKEWNEKLEKIKISKKQNKFINENIFNLSFFDKDWLGFHQLVDGCLDVVCLRSEPGNSTVNQSTLIHELYHSIYTRMISESYLDMKDEEEAIACQFSYLYENVCKKIKNKNESII